MVKLSTPTGLMILFDIVGKSDALELLNTVQRDTTPEDCNYVLSSYANLLHSSNKYYLSSEALVKNYGNPYNCKYAEAVYPLIKEDIVGIDYRQEFVWFVFSIDREALFIRIDVDSLDDEEFVIKHILATFRMVVEYLETLKWDISKFTMQGALTIYPNYHTSLDYISIVAYTGYDGSVFHLESDRYYRAVQDDIPFLLSEPSIHDKPINRDAFNKSLNKYSNRLKEELRCRQQ